MSADRDLVGAIRSAVRAHADAGRAPTMQAYMKSTLPYHGVPMPETRKLVKTAIAAHPIPDREVWEATVRTLFDEATHREEWYAALMLVGHRSARAYLDVGAMPLLEHLITTGAWWDVVDDASHRVGDALLSDRAGVEPVIRRWTATDDLWLRRAAIICQLGHRERTDLDLLTAAIEPAMTAPDFFLRKAIGWALREHAKTDESWVRRFVAAHESALSGLSRREAMKHLSS